MALFVVQASCPYQSATADLEIHCFNQNLAIILWTGMTTTITTTREQTHLFFPGMVNSCTQNIFQYLGQKF